MKKVAYVLFSICAVFGILYLIGGFILISFSIGILLLLVSLGMLFGARDVDGGETLALILVLIVLIPLTGLFLTGSISAYKSEKCKIENYPQYDPQKYKTKFEIGRSEYIGICKIYSK